MNATRSVGLLLRIACVGLPAVLCQSYFWKPETPWLSKVVVAAMAVLASVRPRVGLLVVAAVVPFGRVISNILFEADRARFTEALVLAYVVGWLLQHRRSEDHEWTGSPGLVLGCLLAAVVAGSLLVEIGIYRYWRDYWSPFLLQVFAYATYDYLNVIPEFRPWAHGFGLVSLQTAALFLEGLALMWAAQVLCATDAMLRRRLLQILVLATLGTAMLSVGAAFEMSHVEDRSLMSVFGTRRISVHTPKVNTASSSYLLFLPILLAIAPWAKRAGRRSLSTTVLSVAVLAAGAGLLLTALWMTGSRTGLTAAMAVTVASASAWWVMTPRDRRRSFRSVVALSVTCGAAALFVGVGLHVRTGGIDSLGVRVQIWRTTLAMLAAHPVFGIGVGQFPFHIASFDPDKTLQRVVAASRSDAHNYFLQVAAELGLIGGVLFVGMFAAILWRGWQAFRRSRDALLGGAIAGIVGFLTTCLAGQPLLYEVVAYPFWMVLAVVLAAGNATALETSEPRVVNGSRTGPKVITWFLIVLAVSIPIRVWQGQKERVNFALASYGFSIWHHPDYGQPYRLVRNNGAFFTYPHARWLTLPIRRDAHAGRNHLEVDIFLDGRRARTLSLTNDEWHTVEFMIPAHASRRFRRIDLEIRGPAGVPAQVRVARPVILEDRTLEKQTPAEQN